MPLSEASSPDVSWSGQARSQVVQDVVHPRTAQLNSISQLRDMSTMCGRCLNSSCEELRHEQCPNPTNL